MPTEPLAVPPSPGAESGRLRNRLWVAARVVLGLVGVLVVVGIIDGVGLENLREVIVPALIWLPVAALLELGRVATDAASCRSALGQKGSGLPWGPLMAAHVVAFAVMGVAPAGRASAEAVKASLLARWIGGPAAVAMGTANQANVLISSGSFTLFSSVAAFALTGPSTLTWLLVVHTVAMVIAGVGLRAAARFEPLGAVLAKRFPRLGAHVRSFHDTSHETGLVAPRPVLWMMFGRLLQAVHFGVLAGALGIRPDVLGALTLHGVYLVVAALGVMVPGQIGASEWGFVMAAESLGTTEARAAAIALLAHAIQLAIVLVGFVVLVLWPSRGRGATAS